MSNSVVLQMNKFIVISQFIEIRAALSTGIGIRPIPTVFGGIGISYISTNSTVGAINFLNHF